MIEIDKNLCDKCGSCISICPQNCITLYESYLEIDNDKCVMCKKCVYICPVEALSVSDSPNKIKKQD